MPFAYIVECSDGSYYVGSTWDLERRIGQHNEGLGAEYTRRRRPVSLVWSVQLNRIDEAFRVEKQVQGWGRAKRQALIQGRFHDLPNLARTAQPRERDPVVSTSSTDEPEGSADDVISTSSTDEPEGSANDVVSTSSTDEPDGSADDVVSTSSTDELEGSTRRRLVRRSPGR